MYQFNDGVYVSESILFRAIMTLKDGESLNFMTSYGEVITVIRVLQNLKYSTKNYYLFGSSIVYPFQVHNALINLDKYAYL